MPGWLAGAGDEGVRRERGGEGWSAAPRPDHRRWVISYEFPLNRGIPGFVEKSLPPEPLGFATLLLLFKFGGENQQSPTDPTISPK